MGNNEVDCWRTQCDGFTKIYQFYFISFFLTTFFERANRARPCSAAAPHHEQRAPLRNM